MPKTFLHNFSLEKRSRFLNSAEMGDGPVVYWMSREQRVYDNWPLLYAQKIALEHERQLIVVFCLDLKYPAANLRHFSFLLDGLKEVAFELNKLMIPFFLLEGEPTEVLPAFLKRSEAGLLVCDFDPLKIKRDWKQGVIHRFSHLVMDVDGHNIIPCWLASQKQEYAAYTFRPKVKRQLDTYLTKIPVVVRHPFTAEDINTEQIDWEKLCSRIPDNSVAPVDWLKPGEKAAQKHLDSFIQKILPLYDECRNDPNRNCLSNLSPYLHFGQISAQHIAMEIKQAKASDESKNTFLEELIVRRELADNYCFYNTYYDSFAGFPEWAQKTLNKHRKDKRLYIYDLEEFETAQTHDPLWNAAQEEMALRGKLHGYLRMYWAKKILEWSENPEAAMQIALHLNDKYELDGRDPNGYTGVAWSIGGVHDRAWPERPVFGKIRYMNDKGCARKFNVKQYVGTVNDMATK